MTCCPPIHPALVHFPIALVPLAALLRFVGSSDKALSYLPNVLPETAFTGAHYMTLLALLSMIPTAITGYIEYQKVNNVKVKKLAVYHMLLNTIVGFIVFYNFYTLKNEPGFTPTRTHLYLGLLAVVLLGVSGHIGGTMAYCHRAGQ